MCWSYLMPKSWLKWTPLHSEAGLHDRWAALNCGALHQFDPFKDLQQRVWGRVHHCSQLYRSKGFDIFPSCMFSFLHLCKNKVLFQLDVAVRRSTVLLLCFFFPEFSSHRQRGKRQQLCMSRSGSFSFRSIWYTRLHLNIGTCVRWVQLFLKDFLNLLCSFLCWVLRQSIPTSKTWRSLLGAQQQHKREAP